MAFTPLHPRLFLHCFLQPVYLPLHPCCCTLTPLKPHTAQVLRSSGPFVWNVREGKHLHTMRGRGSESLGPPCWNLVLSNRRTSVYLQPSCFLPRVSSPHLPHGPTWVSIPFHNEDSGLGALPSPATGGRMGCLTFLPPATWVSSSQPGARKPPRNLARFPFPHASRPCRSLRSRARSCLKNPRLGMMPR